MTALARAGAESRHTNLAGSAVLTAAFEMGACEARGTPTADTTHQHKIKVAGEERGGEACWKFPVNAAEQSIHAPNWFTGAKEAWHYYRICYRVEGAIAGTRTIGRIYVTEGELAATIEVTSANKIVLKNGAGTTVAEVTNGLDTTGMTNHNGYHIFEMGLWVHTSEKTLCKARFWWDGTEVHKNEATYTIAKANAPAGARFGWIVAEPTTATLYVDDCGVNNATGTVNNDRLGTATVMGYLDTISDKARENITTGAGGTTELFKCNDDPPEGVATASKTATSQIYSTTSSTTTVWYEPKLESYSTLGVQASDRIAVIRALAYHGRVTTLHSGGIQSISNPAITEVTANTTGADVGAFPVGWIMVATAFVDEPTPTLATEPVLKVRKNTATASQWHVCYMAMLVEWEPKEAAAGGGKYLAMLI